MNETVQKNVENTLKNNSQHPNYPQLRFDTELMGWTILYDASKSYHGQLARQIIQDGRLASLIPSRSDYRSNFRTNVEQWLYNSFLSVDFEQKLNRKVWVSAPLYEMYMQSNRYKLLHMSYRQVVNIRDWFVQQEWIELIVGDNIRSKTTRFRPIGSFRELLVEYLSDLSGNVKIHLPREPLILKDKNKLFVDYKDCAVSKCLRDRLVTYNNRITQHVFHIFLPPSCITLYTSNTTLLNTLKTKHSDKGTTFTLQRGNVHARRIFNNSSWEQGGRYYTDYVNLPKEIRKHIYMDNEPTVELDYKALHANLLYHEKGLEPPENPYQIKLNVPRKTVKKVWVTMLNAETYQSLYTLLNEQVIKGKLNTNGYTPKDIVHSIKELHTPIMNDFYSGKGIFLQRTDSRIATNVIEQIDALVIHDSFIVKESQKHELEQIMKEAYRNETGFDIEVK